MSSRNDDPTDDSVGKYYGRDGQRIGLMTWAALQQDYDGYRLICRDFVGNTVVLTLWHGMDPSCDDRVPPLIFGTITKSSDNEFGNEDLWATEEEARAGHAARVEKERAKSVMTKAEAAGTK